jgi:hypothetical protein
LLVGCCKCKEFDLEIICCFKKNAIDDFLSQILMEMGRGQKKVAKDDF